MAITSQVNMKALLKSQQLSINENVNSKALETQNIVQTETSELDSAVSSINDNVESLTTVNGDISTEVQAVNVHTSTKTQEVLDSVNSKNAITINDMQLIAPMKNRLLFPLNDGSKYTRSQYAGYSSSVFGLGEEKDTSTVGTHTLIDEQAGFFHGIVLPSREDGNKSTLKITINDVEFVMFSDIEEEKDHPMALGFFDMNIIGFTIGDDYVSYTLDYSLSNAVKVESIKIEYTNSHKTEHDTNGLGLALVYFTKSPA